MSSTALAAPTWKPDGDDVATTLTIGGETIDVTLGPVSRERLPRAVVEAWMDRATRAVTTFYGHFPQKHVRLHIFVYDGMGIGGTTYGGRKVELRLGNETPAEALDHDWTLTHELFHTAFPDLDENHLWMQEGMATYFEPLARARIGDYTDERLWGDLFGGLPQGLPAQGDHGLDETPTWGRIYWGGALFWFLADIGIREATANRHSADDALRGILAAGGNGAEDWKIEKVLEVGDKATGTTVLADLYARTAHQPYTPDLEALAKRLGVKPRRAKSS